MISSSGHAIYFPTTNWLQWESLLETLVHNIEGTCEQNQPQVLDPNLGWLKQFSQHEALELHLEPQWDKNDMPQGWSHTITDPLLKARWAQPHLHLPFFTKTPKGHYSIANSQQINHTSLFNPHSTPSFIIEPSQFFTLLTMVCSRLFG